MKVFVTGTDTNIGKTIVSSWLCMRNNCSYFKPIQTGTLEGMDSKTVQTLSGCKIHKEVYAFPESVSPHLAAKLNGETIDLNKIVLPGSNNLIVEGAGGVLVPINESQLMLDLIKKLELPVIVVSSYKLGTINHTLLTLEVLRSRNIPILGVIMNHTTPPVSIMEENKNAIAYYGKTKIIAQLPYISKITRQKLQNVICEKIF